MSSLTRFGRRQSARLQKLSRRQATGLTVVFVLWAMVVAASATGHEGAATALLAVLVTGVLAGVLLLSRRLAGAHRANLAAHRDLRSTVEQMQRRLVAAVEKERLTAGDRQTELAEAIVRVQRTTDRGLNRLQLALPREFEATVQLFQGFTPRAPMPSSGDFALNPTDLLELLHLIRTRRPRLVLELGSGTSTVWIAYVLAECGGRLVSLDHDHEYAQRTRAVLAAHDLTEVAEVREAPLVAHEIDGRTFQWYDADALTDLRDVDFLLVDGPPAATGPDARYPALHVLRARLADSATIVFDDANRRDEQAALRQWTETIAGLSQEREILGRHAVLSYVRAGQPMAPVAS
jgi:predicted O-methyltransferase YrrM